MAVEAHVGRDADHGISADLLQEQQRARRERGANIISETCFDFFEPSDAVRRLARALSAM